MNLAQLKNQSILLLGKTRALSGDEFEKLLGIYNITCKRHFDSSVSLIIEGRMMSPIDQDERDRLYEEGARFEDIDTLEKSLCRSLNPDVIMMSLKLSNDQERLQSFLQNPYIDNTFFLKLLTLYRWSGESFFENDANRDVTAALIRRFYKNIEKNHNVEYANAGLVHLLTQTDDASLVDAIASLEPIQYAIKKGSDNATLKILQRLALHPLTSDALLFKMMRYANSALISLIASREPLSKVLQEKLIDSTDDEVLESLSCNASLEIRYAKVLLQKESYRENILLHVRLNRELFEHYKESYALSLAQNKSLHASMQELLFSMNSDAINMLLASNPLLSQEIIAQMIDFKDEKLLNILISNPQLSSEQLEQFIENPTLHVSLAHNEKCSSKLLEILSSSHNPEVLLALAKNPSTPVDILFQLQLDSRFKRAVQENSAFGKHIQTQNLGWL